MATKGYSGGTTGHPTNTRPAYVMSRVVDCATNVPGSTDVFQVLNIPAKSIVITAGIDVITADTAGNSGTVILGDGNNDNVWVAAAAPSSAGLMTKIAGHTLDNTIFYNTADTIDITFATGVVNAKMRVFAVVCDLDDRDVTDNDTYA